MIVDGMIKSKYLCGLCDVLWDIRDGVGETRRGAEKLGERSDGFTAHAGACPI